MPASSSTPAALRCRRGTTPPTRGAACSYSGIASGSDSVPVLDSAVRSPLRTPTADHFAQNEYILPIFRSIGSRLGSDDVLEAGHRYGGAEYAKMNSTSGEIFVPVSPCRYECHIQP